MKVIKKGEFLPTVCTVYTLLSISKIVLEAFLQDCFGNYQMNLLTMLLLSFLGTWILSQHYRLERFPLAAVIVGQYIVLIAAVMFLTWCLGFWIELNEHACRDMFLSFTIPYVILAAVYYISLFYEIRKANQLLRDIKREE